VPPSASSSGPPQKGGRGWWLLFALGVVCLVGGGVPLLAHAADLRGQQDAGALPAEGVVRVQTAGLVAGVAPGVGSGRPAALAPPPVRLRLSRLHVDAPVLPVSVGPDGLLGVPDNPHRLGWWTRSSRPGMPSGSVVIDGHVDSAALGLGALFRLREARPGDVVLLTDAAGGSIRYTVVARRSYAKTSLPVAEVFASGVSPRLVILTCGGPFDQSTRHYADNIVVYAVPR
jgi:hypothetical protein